jgi:hypothetical protein
LQVVFLDESFKTVSSLAIFGLCDDGEQKPAYLDENDQPQWIAVVNNDKQKLVAFYPLDNRLVLIREDGKPDKICDCLLAHDTTVIFVELKERTDHKWKPEADEQLRSTIAYFEKSPETSQFTVKKAYIANKRRPNFNLDDMPRIKRFMHDTGYVLQITNNITIQ